MKNTIDLTWDIKSNIYWMIDMKSKSASHLLHYNSRLIEQKYGATKIITVIRITKITITIHIITIVKNSS